MLNLLLKKNEVESIYILASAIHNLNTSTPFIEQNILKSKSSIKHDLAFLNNLFVNMGKPTVKVRIIDNEVTLINQNSDLYNNLLFDVCSHLIINSPTYNVISALLFVEKPSKKYVINNSFVSESYLFKILREINSFLAPFKIKIISRKQIYKLIGPPITRLYFEFMLRQSLEYLTHKSLNIEQDTNLRDSIFSSSDINLKLITSLYTTLDVFNERESNIIESTSAIQLINIFIQVNDVTLLIPSHKKTIHQERLIINLFLRLTSGEIDSIEQRTLSSNYMLTLNTHSSENQLLSDAIYITQSIGKLFNFEQSNLLFTELLYLIVIKQIIYELVEYNIESLFNPSPTFLKKLEPATSQRIEIQKKLNLLSVDCNLSKQTKDMLIAYQDRIEDDILSILPTASPVLVIYIDMCYQHSREYYIKQIILNMFSNDSVIFTKTQVDADVIISDRIKKIPESASFFYLINSNSSKAIDLMLLFITNAYLKKMKSITI